MISRSELWPVMPPEYQALDRQLSETLNILPFVPLSTLNSGEQGVVYLSSRAADVYNKEQALQVSSRTINYRNISAVDKTGRGTMAGTVYAGYESGWLQFEPITYHGKNIPPLGALAMKCYALGYTTPETQKTLGEDGVNNFYGIHQLLKAPTTPVLMRRGFEYGLFCKRREQSAEKIPIILY